MNYDNSTSTFSTDHNPYSGGWIGFQILLALSICCCSVTFILTQFHPKLRATFQAQIIKYLTGQGALWSLCCFIQCAINNYHGYFYGDFLACEIQSVYMQFFIFMNGCTLCIMAYSSERRVYLSELQIYHHQVSLSQYYHKWLQSKRSIFLAHLACSVVSFILSISTSLLITNAQLEPSGTFCFLSLQNTANSVLFFSPLLFFGVFLSYRYYRIFSFVAKKNRRAFFGNASKSGESSKEFTLTRQTVNERTPQATAFNVPDQVNNRDVKENVMQMDTTSKTHLAVPNIVFPKSMKAPSLQLPFGSAINVSHAPSPTSVSPSHSRIFEKQVARRMILFVFSYTFCCLPAAVISFFQIFSMEMWISSNPVWYLVAAHLVHLQPLVNAIIYVWLSPQTRRSLVEIVTRLKWASSPTHKSNTVVPLENIHVDVHPLGNVPTVQPLPGPLSWVSPRPIPQSNPTQRMSKKLRVVSFKNVDRKEESSDLDNVDNVFTHTPSPAAAALPPNTYISHIVCCGCLTIPLKLISLHLGIEPHSPGSLPSVLTSSEDSKRVKTRRQHNLGLRVHDDFTLPLSPFTPLDKMRLPPARNSINSLYTNRILESKTLKKHNGYSPHDFRSPRMHARNSLPDNWSPFANPGNALISTVR